MEQRKFPRFPLNCRLVIQGIDSKGLPFSEKTELINISGGGALFYSQQPHLYMTGQTVEANILLPGPPDLQGAMRTSARIMEVGTRLRTKINPQHDAQQVAIHFLAPFKIIRGKQAEQLRQCGRDKS